MASLVLMCSCGNIHGPRMHQLIENSVKLSKTQTRVSNKKGIVQSCFPNLYGRHGFCLFLWRKNLLNKFFIFENSPIFLGYWTCPEFSTKTRLILWLSSLVRYLFSLLAVIIRLSSHSSLLFTSIVVIVCIIVCCK